MLVIALTKTVHSVTYSLTAVITVGTTSNIIRVMVMGMMIITVLVVVLRIITRAN